MRSITATHIALAVSLTAHIAALAFGRGDIVADRQPVERFEINFLPAVEHTLEAASPQNESTNAHRPLVRSRSLQQPLRDRAVEQPVNEPTPPAPAALPAQEALVEQSVPLPVARPAEEKERVMTASAPQGSVQAARQTGVVVAPAAEAVAARTEAERPGGAATVQRLADYLAVIRSMVEGNKEYPAFAKQLGLQGTVVVRAIILSNGTLQQVFITASSGHTSLDKSAIAAVRRTGPFKPPVAFGLSGVTVDIPITYRIN